MTKSLCNPVYVGLATIALVLLLLTLPLLIVAAATWFYVCLARTSILLVRDALTGRPNPLDAAEAPAGWDEVDTSVGDEVAFYEGVVDVKLREDGEAVFLVAQQPEQEGPTQPAAAVSGPKDVKESKPEPVLVSVRRGDGVWVEESDAPFFPGMDKRGWSDTIDVVSRVPKQRKGYQMVTYKGRQYQLHGGIRNDLFIVVRP